MVGGTVWAAVIPWAYLITEVSGRFKKDKRGRSAYQPNGLNRTLDNTPAKMPWIIYKSLNFCFPYSQLIYHSINHRHSMRTLMKMMRRKATLKNHSMRMKNRNQMMTNRCYHLRMSHCWMHVCLRTFFAVSYPSHLCVLHPSQLFHHWLSLRFP